MTLAQSVCWNRRFDLGFERVGMQCAWQVEIDDYCNRVLSKALAKLRRWRDVRNFPPEPVDDCRSMLSRGDPCHANSAAGKSQQSSFGGEFIRVVAALRPRIVVRENPSHVDQTLLGPGGDLELRWNRGYACLPFRLRACCVGAQHRRDRLFLLAEDAYALQRRPDWKGGHDRLPTCRQWNLRDWWRRQTGRRYLPISVFDSRAGIPVTG